MYGGVGIYKRFGHVPDHAMGVVTGWATPYMGSLLWI